MLSIVMDRIDKWFAKNGEYRRREALRNELVRVRHPHTFRGAHMHGSGAVVVVSSGGITALIGAESHKGRTYGRVYLPYRVPAGLPVPEFETEDGRLKDDASHADPQVSCLVFQATGPELFDRHGTAEACRRLLGTIPAVLPLVTHCEPFDVTARIEELVDAHNRYVAIQATLAQ